MPIDDEKDLAVHPGDQPLEEVAEHPGIDPAFHGHEAKVPQRIDRREQVQPVAGPGGLHYRGLPNRCPGGAGMMIRADARFIREKDQRLGAPALHQRRVLLPSPVQRALRGKTKPAHQPSHRDLAHTDGKLPADEHPNHGQRPQGKLEIELLRVLWCKRCASLAICLASSLGGAPAMAWL